MWRSDYVPKIRFLRLQVPAFIFSGVLILGSALSLGFHGLELGIDFTGGTLLEVAYKEAVELGPVREALGEGGFGGALVQHYGTSRDVLVRVPPQGTKQSADLSLRVLEALKKSNPVVELRRVEYVGPQVGSELVEGGGLAMLYTLIGILIYLSMRFEYRLSTGAVVAALHDPFVIFGVFSIFRIEFDLTVLAAILAVIGYSINDTVVVYDRLRENFRKIRKGTTEEIVDGAINQTLSRTIGTSFATLLVVVALYLFGGDTLKGFSLALMIGIVVGTYSSIYVAASLAVVMGLSRQTLMVTQKTAESDNRP